MDKNSIVNEWIDFANQDISSAKFLLGMRPLPLEVICYHCEQAAEKILKGYLILQTPSPHLYYSTGPQLIRHIYNTSSQPPCIS